MGVGILNSKYLHMHLKKKNMSVFINERPRWLYRVFKFLNIEFITVCPKIVGIPISNLYFKETYECCNVKESERIRYYN